MRNLSSIVAGAASVAAAALVTVNASAHIELIDPPPRYVLPANKSCPCGDGDSNRTCQDTAEESTDPARSTNVTTFEAGATITIQAEEYIDHSGRMRVAFDPDGADLADFNDNILMDVERPSDPSIVPGTFALPWEFTVTLPTTPCDNCTLQVIQVMNGVTDTPVADPAPVSTYYTCADIRIVPAGTLGEQPAAGGNTDDGAAGTSAGGSANAAAAGAGGSANAATAGNGGSANAAAAGAGGAPAGRAGTGNTSAAGTGAAVSDADDSDDGGCALQPGSSRASAAWLAALVAGSAIALRRRRR